MARADEAISRQPRKPAFLILLAGRDGFESRHGTTAVHDKDGRAALESVDQSAETVLGFGDAGLFHKS